MPEAALSLAEELSKGFDDAEPAVVESAGVDGGSPDVSAAPEASTETTATAPANGAERTRGPDGKFAKSAADSSAGVVGESTDPAKPAEGQQAQAPEGQEVNNVVDLAPSTFTPAAKAAYQALPKDSPLRADIKKREADYQKGISQYKQAAEQGGSLLAEIQPYMGVIQAEGGTPQRAIKQLLHTAYQLRSGTPQDRGRLVMQIIQQYGADITPFYGSPPAEGQQPAFDPQAIAPMVQQLLSPHLQRIEQFESKFMTAQQQREQGEQKAAEASIEQFRTAADPQGNAKHPYFENVRPLMADFLDKGHAQTMEQAYEMACRAHPEVSAAVTSIQTQQQDAQRLAEAKRKAQEARNASSINATGQGGVGTADISSQSLRDSLSSAYDAQAGGARV